MIKIVQEIELEYFEAWSGGLQVLNAIKEHDRSLEMLEVLESVLSGDEETANTTTQVNDFLWFDAEDIINEHFGIEIFE